MLHWMIAFPFLSDPRDAEGAGEPSAIAPAGSAAPAETNTRVA
jgi:hypothetical protein